MSIFQPKSQPKHELDTISFHTNTNTPQMPPTTTGVTAGKGGLSVSYALSITQTLNWMVRMTSEVETNVVGKRVGLYFGVCLRERDWATGDIIVISAFKCMHEVGGWG